MRDPDLRRRADCRLIQLPVRTRWKRACRWPALVWAYRRAGVSWTTAFRLTHWVIWYDA